MRAPGRYKEWSITDQARGLLEVQKAVRRGDLPPIKTVQCCHCMRRNAQTYHHLNGYDDDHLLDVIPLCYKCHAAEHKRVGWYTGTVTGHEKAIIEKFHAGCTIKALSLEYRAPITVIRAIVRSGIQKPLALTFP